MIKNLPPTFNKYLLTLYNTLWTSDRYPDRWRMAIIIPILKPGKDPLKTVSYRPIAITNTLGKLLEKMVNSRLTHILEAKMLLSPNQNGFRLNRSTTDNLIMLETYVRDGFVQGKSTIGIFFDLEKAYDRTWKYSIIRQMHSMGFRGHLLFYINNFLSKRMFKVQVGSALSNYYEQENGVPQGAVLSCTLFLLAVNDIGKVIPPGIEALHFVDDMTLLFRSTNIETATVIMQRAVDKMSEWAKNTGLSFSPTKSQCMIFSKKRRIPDVCLTLSGRALPVVETVKYLGLLLDKKLTWRPHIEDLRARCLKDLNLLRMLQGLRWGADRLTLLQLYRVIVRSKIDYGCVVYSSAKYKDLRRLDPVHNTGLRLAIGAFKTSPVSSILVEANEPSLALRRDFLLLRYGIKIKRFPGNFIFEQFTHPQFENKYLQQPIFLRSPGLRFKALLEEYALPLELIKITKFKFSTLAPWTTRRPITKFGTRNKQDFSRQEELRQEHNKDKVNHPASHPFYTDGSKILENTGCAYSSSTGAGMFACSKWSSVISIELEGILQALHAAANLKLDKVTIYTDSQSALLALGKLYIQNLTVIKIRHLIDHSNLSVRFIWIPGHVGISGNDTADRLAKLAINDGLPVETEIFPRDLDQLIRTKLKEKWQQAWTDNYNNKLRFTKHLIGNWKTSYRQNRHEETIICRLRIGHTRLTHSYLFTPDKELPKCRLCNDSLTVAHILTDCQPLEQLRNMYDLPDSLSEILGDNPLILHRLFDYLKRAELYDAF